MNQLELDQRTSTIPPVILLATGREFDMGRPAANEPLPIECIASSLAKLCRFTGHTKAFYSVAQHSVLVSMLVPPQYALHGLLHDAGEVVTGDLSSPLKRWITDHCPAFRDFLRNIEVPIWRSFGLPDGEPAEVRHADLVALATEKRDLMPATAVNWDILEGIQAHPSTIYPLSGEHACAAFLRRYHQLVSRST